jgi:hypothetical protein
MKKVTSLALLLVMSLAGSALATQQILHLSGNAWEDDGPGGTFPPSNPGDAFNICGILNDIEYPLVWDTSNYSYTMWVRGLVSLGETVFGTTHVASFSGGFFTIYVDFLPSNADYGVDPPNATAPSTFNDGISVYLDGYFTGFSTTFNTATQAGTFSGTLNFTGGDVYPLLTATDGWTFGANIAGLSPQGYDLEMNGDVYLQVVAVEPHSWGGVKSLYR